MQWCQYCHARLIYSHNGRHISRAGQCCALPGTAASALPLHIQSRALKCLRWTLHLQLFQIAGFLSSHAVPFPESLQVAAQNLLERVQGATDVDTVRGKARRIAMERELLKSLQVVADDLPADTFEDMARSLDHTHMLCWI
jgi:hypothetical protein